MCQICLYLFQQYFFLSYNEGFIWLKGSTEFFGGENICSFLFSYNFAIPTVPLAKATRTTCSTYIGALPGKGGAKI